MTGPAATMAARYLGAASDNLFAMRRTLSSYGATPLRLYVGNALRVAPSGYQTRADRMGVVHEEVSATLGPALAASTVEDLERSPMVLTANHHGVDFFAQSLNSSLAFSLRSVPGAPAPSTTPVFACGAVPLNNFTYPRGLLAYRGGDADRLPVRIPVFPDRMKRHLVSTARGVTGDMIERAKTCADRLIEQGVVAPDLAEPIHQVLAREYADSAVLGESCYSRQAVKLNHRIWKRLFRHSQPPREIVYLELEKVAARLLALDLLDENSVAWRTFFDPAVRSLVLDTLDGKRACWNRRALDERLRRSESRSEARPGAAGGGTVFFWAVDGAGRGVPLDFSGSGPGVASLVGVDGHGRRLSFPVDPSALVEALDRRSLIPSLFTSYLTISLARGVSCIGGYYQAEYLPVMQQAVVSAFAGQGGSDCSVARAVASIPTHGYLSGMQAVMSEVRDRTLAPAGALEIMAGGGLCDADLERIGNLTVGEAHLASVVDTVMDAAPGTIDGDGWQSRVGKELHEELGSRVVMQ